MLNLVSLARGVRGRRGRDDGVDRRVANELLTKSRAQGADIIIRGILKKHTRALDRFFKFTGLEIRLCFFLGGETRTVALHVE
jgi:hypothetical protein